MLKEIINQVATELGIEVKALEIKSYHLHLLTSAYLTIPVHKIVRRIEGRTSYILRKEFIELLKLPSLWTHVIPPRPLGISTEAIQDLGELLGDD